ncbi:hypothetical protein [Saezia sanguinis]|nr:hypothetical protein [Saezia sanguinis]
MLMFGQDGRSKSNKSGFDADGFLWHEKRESKITTIEPVGNIGVL